MIFLGIESQGKTVEFMKESFFERLNSEIRFGAKDETRQNSRFEKKVRDLISVKSIIKSAKTKTSV